MAATADQKKTAPAPKGTGQSEPEYHDDVHAHLMSETGGEAEAARIASGFAGENATEATEAETPAENIAHISDASLPPRVQTDPKPSKAGKR